MTRHRAWRVTAGGLVLVAVASTVVWRSLVSNDPGQLSPVEAGQDEAAAMESVADAAQPHGVLARPDASPLSDTVSHAADDSLWAIHMNALSQAARRGDRAASTRLFEESHACRRYHSALAGASARLEDRSILEADWATARDFEDAEAALDEMQQAIESASILCAGSDADHVDAAFQDFLLLAAQQGNAQARSCYLVGLHSTDSSNPEQEQERIDQYLRHVPVFSESVLEQADWPGVQVLAYRLLSAPPEPTTRLDQALLPDPYLIWRALRLNYYRAGAEDQAYVRDLLNQVAHRFVLSELDLQVADQWAQARFDQLHAGQPALEGMESTTACPGVVTFAP